MTRQTFDRWVWPPVVVCSFTATAMLFLKLAYDFLAG